MAYISQQIPDEEKNKFGRSEDTTPNPLPPQTGGSTTPQGQGGIPGVASSTQFGSNAANLSDYLKANESQVEDFGNKVAGNLTEGYNNALGAVDQGFSDFNNQVNAGYTPNDSNFVNQATSNPTDFVKNPDNVSKFQKLYNDQYTGPQNFESGDSYANINNQVNQATQNAGLTKSFSGLGSYLNNFMGTGGNTPGMNTLDTALLQRSPTASKAIQTAAAPYENLGSYLSGKASTANQNVANAKDVASQTAQGIQNQFNGEGGIVPTFQNNINQRFNQQSTQATNELNAMNKLKSGGVLNPQEIQMLGITPEQYGSYRNMLANLNSGGMDQYNPSGFFTKNINPGDVTLSSSANPDEFAISQALAQLTGQNSFLNQDEANLSGTAPYDTSFRADDATNAIADIWRRFGTGGGGVIHGT